MTADHLGPGGGRTDVRAGAPAAQRACPSLSVLQPCPSLPEGAKAWLMLACGARAIWRVALVY